MGPGGRGGLRLLGIALGALFAGLVLAASPAAAHATLLSTDPADGSVLAQGPEAIRLVFDEPVRIEAGAVQVVGPDGTRVTVTSREDATAVVTTPVSALGDGTYVVDWQVVADDGHPLTGSFSFSVGASSPMPTVAHDRSPPAATDATLGVVQAAGYVGLLLTVGLVWFAIRLEPGVRERLRDPVLALGSLTALAALVWVPSIAAYQSGSTTEAAWGRGAWSWARHSAELTEMGLMVVGLVLAVVGFLAERHRVAGVGGLVAVVGPAFFGHDRGLSVSWLMVAADAAHLVAGATWLGGLVGILLLWRHLSRADLGRTIRRVSSTAGIALAVIVVTGSLAAVRILGSVTAVVESSWGRLLLVKLALVAVVVGLGLRNRLRLDDPDLRAVLAEAALLIVVLGVTGFLTNADPVPHEESGQTGSSQTLRSGPFGTTPVGFTSLWTT